jgi:predicted NAD/FAD-binding protein
MQKDRRLKVAIVGTGISGLSAAWLLSRHHDVTVYESSERIGGHSNTVLASVDGRSIPVDTGFIVFNRLTYPNLTALFELLEVPTEHSDMSFAASLDDGNLEYSGTGLCGLFAQRRNLFRPRFWSMLADLVRFYREAKRGAGMLDDERISLGDYLAKAGYGTAFRNDHILPMASAIWCSLPADVLAYPAASFIRFHDNHGLLQLRGRPTWETVSGGSRSYVERLIRPFADRIRCDTGVVDLRRTAGGAIVTDSKGGTERYDHVVMATHADQTLAVLADPSPGERELLGAFRYSRNLAVLHSDVSFMPKRRSVWSSWNYIGPRNSARDGVCVTYWMNRLQNLKSDRPLFVTLNPPRPPGAGSILHSEVYDHPIFDAAAIAAQRRLWSLQGHQNTWFCGAYFGAGFHEDGLQAGLAVAEQLGGLRRPWSVPNESGRIVIASQPAAERAPALLS